MPDGTSLHMNEFLENSYSGSVENNVNATLLDEFTSRELFTELHRFYSIRSGCGIMSYEIGFDFHYVN